MKQQLTRSRINSQGSDLVSACDERNGLLNWGIREQWRNESFFTEALLQIDRDRETSERRALIDWEDFGKNRTGNFRLGRSLSPYRVRLLASESTSFQMIVGEHLEGQFCLAIAHLAREPRPDHSIELPIKLTRADWQPRQIELGSWRILYAVDEDKQEVIVVAIAPPENDFVSSYFQENSSLGERPHLLGHWEYHYC